MAWKKKEKELTPEEAIQAAKNDAAPFWFDSSPLLTSVETNQGFTIYPLEQSFLQGTYLLAFFDITNNYGEIISNYLRLWEKRYGGFGIKFLIVFVPPGKFSTQKTFVTSRMEYLQFTAPVAVDVDSKILKGYGQTKFPVLMLIKGQRRIAQTANIFDLETFELDIQNYLRETDKGLPLPQVTPDQKSFHLPKKNYLLASDGVPVVKLADGINLAEIRSQVKPGSIYTMGNWSRDEEKLSTNDSKAKLFFIADYADFSMIAASLTKLIENGKAVIEIDENTIYQTFVGEDLRFDDMGNAFIAIKEHKIYKMVHDLPPDKRFVEVRFPNASRIPVGIYSILFSETSDS